MSEYKHNIGSKGRLIIPAKIREALGDNFTLTRGLDNCLYLHPEDEWNEFQNKLKQLPITFNKKARKYVRFFTAGATSCEVDKQGRILIPATLREFATLQKEVIITWNIDKAEIWSKERWDELNSFDDMDELAEALMEEGFVF